MEDLILKVIVGTGVGANVKGANVSRFSIGVTRIHAATVRVFLCGFNNCLD